ncbi:hypothetical protein RKLH11_200 [Rhodobacteraceae bacterium KLH11]|nr:hypothetical protein RKLH11_200 [Rhodobacteraceae bacterium KLH11]
MRIPAMFEQVGNSAHSGHFVRLNNYQMHVIQGLTGMMA